MQGSWRGKHAWNWLLPVVIDEASCRRLQDVRADTGESNDGYDGEYHPATGDEGHGHQAAQAQVSSGSAADLFASKPNSGWSSAANA